MAKTAGVRMRSAVCPWGPVAVGQALSGGANRPARTGRRKKIPKALPITVQSKKTDSAGIVVATRAVKTPQKHQPREAREIAPWFPEGAYHADRQSVDAPPLGNRRGFEWWPRPRLLSGSWPPMENRTAPTSFSLNDCSCSSRILRMSDLYIGSRRGARRSVLASCSSDAVLPWKRSASPTANPASARDAA